eukprot:1547472-Pyramimonas_sp.AAC.1
MLGLSRGHNRAPLGPSWGSFGASWGPLGAFLVVWETSWGHLATIVQTEKGFSIPVAPSEARKCRLGTLFGRSWSAPGRSWG